MQKYNERLNDISVIQLNTEGFESLTKKQKQLSFYLAQAGLWGRAISVDQGSRYNIPLFNALISLYRKTPKEHDSYQSVKDTLFTMFAHNGIYHSTSGEKLSLPISLDNLESLQSIDSNSANIINDILFTGKIAQFRTLQTEGVDVIKDSGGNFYENLTTDEVKQFRKNNYPIVESDEVPPFGFNEKLLKTSAGNILRQVISIDGLYGNFVQQIVKNLEMALDYVENEQQLHSISSLIEFYKTGDAFDFDTHCVAWTQDKESHIYFINGLIESYEDPLGIGCTFESIVAFKNPIQTAKVSKIIEHIQWFEDTLPFDNKFKKEKAVGLSASSVNVISTAGETAPTLPLGINLPNSDWIRKKHGSKSVNLANVAASRTASETELRNALYLPKYHTALEKFGTLTNNLHTDLHEIAGHGSGKVLEGVNTDVLGTYYATIEETRADLVALFFIGENKLKDIGVYDNDVIVEEAALAQYVSYLTNGAFAQLRRVDLGNDLTQAHLRNRQLISNWVLENSDPEKVCLTTENNLTFVEVNDVKYVKDMFGKLLSKIQEIKSTGDFDSARELVMTYGTKVNQNLHKELLERLEKLDLPKTVAFITPMLNKHGDSIVLEQPTNFLEQQLELYETYMLQNIKLTQKMKIK